MLNDEEWSQWSNREIARQCEVSRRMVDKYRNETTGNDAQSKRKGADGRTIDTSNIGSNKDTPDLPDNVNPETGEVLED